MSQIRREFENRVASVNAFCNAFFARDVLGNEPAGARIKGFYQGLVRKMVLDSFTGVAQVYSKAELAVLDRLANNGDDTLVFTENRVLKLHAVVLDVGKLDDLKTLGYHVNLVSRQLAEKGLVPQASGVPLVFAAPQVYSA